MIPNEDAKNDPDIFGNDILSGSTPPDAGADSIRAELDELTRSLADEIDTVAAELTLQTRTDIADAMRDYARIVSEIKGSVISVITDYDAAVDKINKAVGNKLIEDISSAYSFVGAMGGSVPSSINEIYQLTQEPFPHGTSATQILGLAGVPDAGTASVPGYNDPDQPPPPPRECLYGFHWDESLQMCVPDNPENLPPPPTTIDPPYQPPPTPPITPLPPDNGFMPPTAPPPFEPPPGSVVPVDGECPTGFYLVEGVCVPWFTPPPPLVPPPTAPPIVPPVVPPDRDNCMVPPDTVQLSCRIVPPIWIVRYWITVKCRGCKCPEICVWSGVNEPTGGDWDYISPPYDRPPTDLEIRSQVIYCIDKCGYAPPKDVPPDELPLPPPPSGEPEPAPEPRPTPPPTPPRGAISLISASGMLWDTDSQCRAADAGAIGAATDDVILEAQEGWQKQVYADLQPLLTTKETGTFGFVGAIFNNAIRMTFVIPILAVMSAIRLVTGAGRSAGNGQMVSSMYPRLGTIIPHFIQHWFGFDLTYYFQDQIYTSNYLYPTQLPEQPVIDELFLTDRIDEYAWTCYTRAHGNLPDIHRQARDARQVRTNVNEVVELLYRGQLTHSQAILELRRRGVTDSQEAERLISLYMEIPTQGDIDLFMKREVDNKAKLDLYHLDQRFDIVYSDNIKKWANQRGLSDELMKYKWRAHWTQPSPTDGFQFIRRLREGRVAPELVFTRANLNLLLTEAEYPPGLIDRYVEVSYNPITRSDVIKGNKAGHITYEEMIERFQDVGYSKDNATLLAKIIQQDNDRQIQQSTGLWTQRTITRQYRDGLITRSNADSLLSRYIIDEKVKEQILEDADMMIETDKKKKCIKAFRMQFMHGLNTANEVQDGLVAVGLDEYQADQMVKGWQCERTAMMKEPRITALVKWYKQGIMDAQQVYEALLHLRVQPADADRYMKSADIEISKAQRDAAIRDARDRENAQRRQRTDFIREVKFAAWVRDDEAKQKKASQPKKAKGGNGGQSS